MGTLTVGHFHTWAQGQLSKREGEVWGQKVIISEYDCTFINKCDIFWVGKAGGRGQILSPPSLLMCGHYFFFFFAAAAGAPST